MVRDLKLDLWLKFINRSDGWVVSEWSLFWRRTRSRICSFSKLVSELVTVTVWGWLIKTFGVIVIPWAYTFWLKMWILPFSAKDIFSSTRDLYSDSFCTFRRHSVTSKPSSPPSLNILVTDFSVTLHNFVHPNYSLSPLLPFYNSYSLRDPWNVRARRKVSRGRGPGTRFGWKTGEADTCGVGPSLRKREGFRKISETKERRRLPYLEVHKA